MNNTTWYNDIDLLHATWHEHVAPTVEDTPTKKSKRFRFPTQTIGSAFVAVALGGLVGPLSTTARMEGMFALNQAKDKVVQHVDPQPTLPPSTPVLYDPLEHNGELIAPVSRQFGLVVPKIGINAEVLPYINPLDTDVYNEALKKGVAHSSLSYTPDEDGTVYLFSHSTNYDWFVEELNAIFYHLKKLEPGDEIVLFYEGKQYVYRLRKKEVVDPQTISYLVPQGGHKGLILQTCWPPGSLAERLLIFADLVEEDSI